MDCPVKGICKSSGSACELIDLVGFCWPVLPLKKHEEGLFCHRCGKKDENYSRINEHVLLCRECLKDLTFSPIAMIPGVKLKTIEKVLNRF
jgi:ribosomal protein S14